MCSDCSSAERTSLCRFVILDYLSDFRKTDLAEKLVTEIVRKLGDREVTFMEVCGGHTAAVLQHGIHTLLPPNLHLLSGPGCPVCVTSTVCIKKAIEIAKSPQTILVTFGDMLRVPAQGESLESVRAQGANVKVVYSPFDALGIAERSPDRKVVLFAIGFETTAPGTAAVLMQARAKPLDNLFVLCAHKTMPQAMEGLVNARELAIDGFLCPGHVSTIIGSEAYAFLAERYRVACAVAGFEPLDILQAILSLVTQAVENNPTVETCYRRSVCGEGNRRAKEIMYTAYENCDSYWRGIGNIANSGMRIREEFSRFDAEAQFAVSAFDETRQADFEQGCLCGSILRGLAQPRDCPFFGTRCTPREPVGACMVSSEGACHSHFLYRSQGNWPAAHFKAE